MSIAHRHIPSASPEVNGNVERSHKTDAQEFYRGKRFRSHQELAPKLEQWQKEYNGQRPHLAFKGNMPTGRVLELGRHSPTARNP